MKKAIFPGSFDPFTIGHQFIVNRALDLVDEITIAIGINSKKKSCFSVEKRVEFIQHVYKNESKIKVATYDSLTVDFAIEIGAQFILRGIRTVSDFEYEKNIADINKKLTGTDTFILFAEPEYAHISSSLIRELLYFKKDISNFIPKEINLLLNEK